MRTERNGLPPAFVVEELNELPCRDVRSARRGEAHISRIVAGVVGVKIAFRPVVVAVADETVAGDDRAVSRILRPGVVQVRRGPVGQPDLKEFRRYGGRSRGFARKRFDLQQPHGGTGRGVVSARLGEKVDAGEPVPSGGAVDGARGGEIEFNTLFPGEIEGNLETVVTASLCCRVVGAEAERDDVVAFCRRFQRDPDSAAAGPVERQSGLRQRGMAMHVAPESLPDAPVKLFQRPVRQIPLARRELLIGPEILFGKVPLLHDPDQIRAEGMKIFHLRTEGFHRGGAIPRQS